MNILHLFALISVLIVWSNGNKIGWRKLAANSRYSNLNEDQTVVFQKNLLNGIKKSVLHYSDVILVFGKVGTGKSSLACFLAGENLTVVEYGGAAHMIDNHDRIGRCHPWTLYPELFLHEKNRMVFYDLPGHTIDSDAGFDSLSKFFTERLLRYVKYIRILAVFEYRNFNSEQAILLEILDTIQFRLNKEEFEKFYKSIGLAISFVPLYIDSDVHVTTDEQFRHIYRNLLQKALGKVDTDFGHFDYHTRENVKMLVRHFINHFKEIVLFRIPLRKGNVHEMPSHVDSHIVARNLLHLKTFKISIQNFSIFQYRINGSDIQVYVDSAKDVVNSGLIKLSTIIKNYFANIIENSVNHNVTIGIFEDWMKKYQFMLETIKFSCSSTRASCIMKIFQRIREMKIPYPRNLEFRINANYKYLMFVEILKIKRFESLKTKQWVDKLEDVLSYLIFSKNYLTILINYQNTKSIQKYKTETKIKIKRVSTKSCCGKYVLKKSTRNSKLGLLGSVFVDKKLPDKEEISNAYQIDENHITQTHDSKFFAEQVDIQYKCVTGWKQQEILQIKGYYLDFNSISAKILGKNLTSLCGGQVFRIELYALEHIVLNNDFRDLFDKKNEFSYEVAIISPKWIVNNAIVINLNGKNGKDRDDQKDHYNRSGLPGRPGEPAFGFLGIGSTFENSHLLTVSSVGGNGGRGAKAQTGYAGRDPNEYAKDWEALNCKKRRCIVSKSSSWYASRHLSIKRDDLHYLNILFGPLVLLFQVLFLDGMVGEVGHKGGDGGGGGHGGYGNEMILISMRDEKHSINAFGGQGRNGTDGTGGAGGIGGLIECDFAVLRITFIGDIRIWTYGDHGDFCGRAKSGPRGTDGNYTEGIKNAKESIPFLFPHNTVNEFKSYLVENLAYRTKRNEFIKYYNYLEKNEKVEKLYTVQGLIVNYIILENNFLQLNAHVDYIRFYESLSERIDSFNVDKVDMYEGKTIENLYNPKFRPLTEEEKAIARKNNRIALKILNATLWRKINYLKNRRYNTKVILNPVPFLIETNNTVILYKNLSAHVKEREAAREQMKKLIHKFHLLNAKIEQDFKPEFKNITDNLKNGLLSLVEEVQVMITKQISDLKKRSLLSMIKMAISVVATILSFIPGIGQIGQAAIGLVDTVSGFVIDQYMPELKLPEGVTNSLTAKEEMFELDLETTKRILREIEKEIPTGNHSDPETKKKLKKFKDDIKQVVHKTLNIKKKGYDSKKLNAVVRLKIKKYCTANNLRKISLEQIHGVLRKHDLLGGLQFSRFALLLGLKEDYVEIIEGVENLVSAIISNDKVWGAIRNANCNLLAKAHEIVSKGIYKCTKAFQQVRQVFRSLKFLKIAGQFLPLVGVWIDSETTSRELKEEEDKLFQLVEFKQKIRSETVPTLELLANKVDQADFMEVTLEQFEFLLDSITKLKDTLVEMVEGFEIKSSIHSHVSKLENLLISFEEQFHDIQLAKIELKNLESSNAKLAETDGIQNNTYLAFSIQDLNVANVKNNVVNSYEEATRIVDILFFPQPNKYYVSYELMKIKNINSSVFDEYVENVQKSIESMIHLYKQSYCDANNMYFSNDFTNASSLPFFSWYQKLYMDRINRLLSGEEILMYAVIKATDHDYHAIKFREIAIEFTLKLNHTLEERLRFNKYRELISECIVNLTMFGDSEYKCAKYSYEVSSNIYKFSHSYSAFANNTSSNCFERVYLYENEEYANLKKLPHVLSPYGSWNISIQCHDGNNYLKELIGLVDLHLIGSGTYVLAEDCPEQITQFTRTRI